MSRSSVGWVRSGVSGPSTASRIDRWILPLNRPLDSHQLNNAQEQAGTACGGLSADIERVSSLKLQAESPVSRWGRTGKQRVDDSSIRKLKHLQSLESSVGQLSCVEIRDGRSVPRLKVRVQVNRNLLDRALPNTRPIARQIVRERCSICDVQCRAAFAHREPHDNSGLRFLVYKPCGRRRTTDLSCSRSRFAFSRVARAFAMPRNLSCSRHSGGWKNRVGYGTGSGVLRRPGVDGREPRARREHAPGVRHPPARRATVQSRGLAAAASPALRVCSTRATAIREAILAASD